MKPTAVLVSVYAGEWDGEKDVPSQSILLGVNALGCGSELTRRLTDPEALWNLLRELSWDEERVLREQFGYTKPTAKTISLDDLEIIL